MALAILFALLAATGWGASAIFVRLGLQNISSTTGTALSLATGTLLIGAIAFAVHGPDDFAISSTAIGWIALLGLLNYLLGRFLNFNSIRLAGVSRAAPLLAAAPLVAVTLGVLVGGETLEPLIALGTLVIVGGVVLIVTAPEQR